MMWSLLVALHLIYNNSFTTLAKSLHLKDLGQLHYILGLEVQLFPSGLFLSQTKYSWDLLKLQRSMLESSNLSTPITVKPPITPDDNILVDTIEYRSIVGALQYLIFTALVKESMVVYLIFLTETTLGGLLL